MTNFEKINAGFDRVTTNLFICGVDSLNMENINNNNICYIVCTMEITDELRKIHENLLYSCPCLYGILYIPLSDTIDQNLWELNNNRIRYCKLSDCVDIFNEKGITNIPKYYENWPLIEIGNNFIGSILQNNNSRTRILIHCYAGMSRSVTFCSFYIMNAHNISFDDTLFMIKRGRIIANPNVGFCCQLRAYDDYRKNKNNKLPYNSK